jgi:limonene-1,2-epoxide hydrolase
MATAITEKELIELERKFWKAMQDRDVEAAKKLTDFPCIVMGPQGVGKIDEKEFTKMMDAESYRLVHFDLKEGAKVTRLGDDVAVIAYEAREDLTVDGKPVTLDVAETSTWVRRDGRWCCAQHSEAIEGDPFGRDRVPVSDPRSYSSPYAGEEAWGSE